MSKLPPPSSKSRTAKKAPGTKKEDKPKSFSIKPLSSAGEGEKILVYAPSGMGKTTIAAQIEGAVFVPLDDGARKVLNPLTQKPVNAVAGVETYNDLRDLFKQAPKLIPKGGTLVIDTITRMQPLVEQWVIENISTEKGNAAKNIEAFGYGKGYRHILDAIRVLLTDLDKIIRKGVNIVLLAQVDQDIVPNPAGDDYYQEVPKLIQNKQGPVRTEVCEWVDHVLRLGYLDVDVAKDKQSKAGKVISQTTERAIFTGGAQHFVAKSRPIDGETIPPVISFQDQSDNSLWQYIFPEEGDSK